DQAFAGGLAGDAMSGLRWRRGAAAISGEAVRSGRSPRRRARLVAGQAAAEAAIGMLVFVTVLMFGLHFAEVGYLTVKIQEAANGALWDTTAKKMHDIP